MSEIKTYRINDKEIWQGALNKINGEIQERPIRFIIRPLGEEDAPAMGKLSENIYQNLRRGEECFIHKHSKQYFYKVFQKPQLYYNGVFVGDELVGMSYLKICRTGNELEEELPNASYDFFAPSRNAGNSLVGSLGADSVLPAYRGNALNSIMINYRLNQAEQLGCTDCTSIVDRKNRWNMSPYFNNRFNLFATAIDPSDGGQISLLHKPIGQETVLSCFKPKISLPYERLDIIDGLLAKGFIGVAFDKERGEVLFAHSDYYQVKENVLANIWLQKTLLTAKRRI